jgi:hypothetical protein
MSERLSADIQTFEQKVAVRDKWFKKLADAKNELQNEKKKIQERFESDKKNFVISEISRD